MLVTGVYDVVDHSPEGMAEHHWLVVLHAHSVVDGPCGTDLEGLVVSQAVLGHDLASLADRVLCCQKPIGATPAPGMRGATFAGRGRAKPRVTSSRTWSLSTSGLSLADLWLPRPMFFVTLSSLLSSPTGSRGPSRIHCREWSGSGATAGAGHESAPEDSEVSELRSRLEWRPALRLECPAQRTIAFLEDRPIVSGGLRQELKSELRGLRCGRRGLDCSSDALHQG